MFGTLARFGLQVRRPSMAAAIAAGLRERTEHLLSVHQIGWPAVESAASFRQNSTAALPPTLGFVSGAEHARYASR